MGEIIEVDKDSDGNSHGDEGDKKPKDDLSSEERMSARFRNNKVKKYKGE